MFEYLLIIKINLNNKNDQPLALYIKKIKL